MRLFITPSDVLLFRGGLPYIAGESSLIKSDFPPSPETMQGAIRALIAAQWAATYEDAFKNDAVKQLIGDQTTVNGQPNYGRFRLDCVSPGYRKTDATEGSPVTRIFPLPAHIVARKKADDGAYDLLAPANETAATIADAQTNWPTALPAMRWLLPKPDVHLPLRRGARWLYEAELTNCLTGGTLAPGAGLADDNIFQLEPRTGIALERAPRTTKDGLFYQTWMLRMREGFGFVADFHFDSDVTVTSEDLHLPKRGWMTIGGERRAATYEVIADTPPTPVAAPAGNTLLYFATPAYFAEGWRPTKWATFGATPVAAAIPGAQLIGGWSLDPANAGGDAKSMRRFVPVGSVYFFENAISASGPFSEYGEKIGFGHAFKGVWQ